MFAIVEEGVDKENPEYKIMLKQKVVTFLEKWKVSRIEDLCVEFDMSTKEAVEMIWGLEAEGRIKGIMDERGKYILITQDEL